MLMKRRNKSDEQIASDSKIQISRWCCAQAVDPQIDSEK